MKQAVPPPIPAIPRPAGLAKPLSAHGREWLFRVVIVVALLGSVGLAWWTLLKVMVPLQRQSRERSQTLSHLSTEVDQLERKWSKADIARVQSAYNLAHSRLFSDQAALEGWLAKANQPATAWGLETKVEFGKSATRNTNDVKLAIIPANVSVQVLAKASDEESAFQRLIRMGRQLTAEGKRADLTEVTVTGGTNVVLSAMLSFELWGSEE